MRSPLVTVAIAVAVFLAGLPAQQRRPLVGRVLDAAGVAVVSAEVTFVWSPPGGPECGATDVVTVATDERGRFVAKLLLQESYSAWAIATAADGTARASLVREGAAAGGDLELRLEHPALPRPIEVAGAEAWATLAPLRVEVAPGAANVLRFPVGANGLTRPLPPLGFAFVHGADGQVLFATNLPRASPADPVKIWLPLPQSVKLRVVGVDGKPLAGATVHHATAPTHSMVGGFAESAALFDRPAFHAWRCGGTTAADGTVTAVAPVLPANSGSPLLVRLPGMAESIVAPVAANPGLAYIDGTQTAPAADGTFLVTMHRAARLRIVQDGTPVRGAEVLLTAGYSAHSLERVVALRLDDSGTCELPIPLDPVETMLHVRSKPGDAWQLRRIPVTSGEITWCDLARQRRLSLQFVDENGGPARGLTGVLMAVGSRHAGNQQVVVCTDQAGRLERTLGGDEWLLFVTDGVRWKRFDIPRGGEPGPPPTITATLVCEPLTKVEFHVRDVKGTPVPGASIHSVFSNHAAPRGPAEAAFTTLVNALGQRFASRPQSDAQGRLLLSMVPQKFRSQRARITAPGFGSTEVPFALGDIVAVVLPAAAGQPGR